MAQEFCQECELQIRSESALVAGVHLKALFAPLKIGLIEISRSRFKQNKNHMLIRQINVLGCFVNFLVIFRYMVYLGGDSFSQKSGKIWRNKK